VTVKTILNPSTDAASNIVFNPDGYSHVMVFAVGLAGAETVEVFITGGAGAVPYAENQLAVELTATQPFARLPTGPTYSIDKSASAGAVSVYWSGASASAVTTVTTPGGTVVEFPIAPEFAIYSIDHLDSDGRVVANRYASTPPNGNIFTLSTGYIRSAGGAGVLTNNFANGPGGSMTASRVEFAADTTTFLLYSGAPPANNYRLRLPVKLNSGGPTKDIRYGDTLPGYLTATVNDATWTYLDVSPYAASGTTYDSFAILPAAANAPVDLLIDELQWYPSAETMPAFATETNDWHFKVRNKGYAGAISRSGNLLDNLTGGAVGSVLSPTFPAAKTFTEFCAVVAFDYRTLGSGQLFVTEADASLGTTVNTLQIGVTAGSVLGQVTFQPVNQGTTRIEPVNEGVHIYAIRIRNGARECYFNGVELNSASTAWAGFQARMLNLYGSTTATPARGFPVVAVAFPSYPSDADFFAIHEKIRNVDVPAAGQVMGTFSHFLLSDGDSISASTGAPQGPAYPYLLGAAGAFAGKPPLYMRNRSVSSSGIVDLNTRKAKNLQIIAQAIAAGAQPIVTILCATNDTAEIGSLGHAAYYDKLALLYADYRNAGAIVIAATPLPANVGNPAWNAERLLLAALMRTRVGLDFEGLADLAADPDIGPDGAPAARVYYDDDIHLNTAGQVIAAGIFETAIDPFFV